MKTPRVEMAMRREIELLWKQLAVNAHSLWR